MNRSKRAQQRVRAHARLPSALAILAVGLSCIAVGLGIGCMLWRHANGDIRYRLASAGDIAQAKASITRQFLADSSIKCSDPSDPIKPADRVAVFQKYLRVNKYANRAVIRGCNNMDSMLAKDVFGGWRRTTINVALDSRVNPVWQDACLIIDITTADTVTRPENSSIDIYNLVDCMKLQQTEMAAQILRADRITVDQQTIDAYTQNVPPPGL